MKCKEIQEFILTDYLDNVLNKKTKEKLDAHMVECLECREFLAAARKMVIEPFKKSKRVEMQQERIWERIEQEIAEPEKENILWNPFSSTIEKARNILMVRKPAFAMATASLVLLMILSIRFLPFSTKSIKGKDTNTLEYYVSLNDSWEEDDLSFGTVVEEYLL